MKFGIGQPARRVEDARFITGTGLYTADLIPDGALEVAILRSPHAHARFRIADLETARAVPGVRLILTGADVAKLGDFPCHGTARNADGSAMWVPPYPVLPRDTVRHVGEAVAFVVAETRAAALDALEAIAIDWEPLPAAVSIAGAAAEDAPLVWPQAPGNVAFDAEVGDRNATDAAFAKAARVVSLTLVNNRVVANYLEPRACLAEYDGATARWTLTLGSQGSHGIRDILARDLLKVDPARIRVVTPDVGGGFGTRIFAYRDYALCAVAAERLGQPVAWRGDRADHFLGDAQGRDNLTRADLALDDTGRFLALRVDLQADMGAMLSQYGPFVPSAGARMLPGVYAIPAVHARVRGYYSHTVPVDAYRGAGRPEAAYVIERLVDHAARELGVKPERLRRRNFIRPRQMPYRTATGRVYDSGEFDGHMTRAMELADWKGFPTRRAAARKRGLVRGIGLATYIEACSGGGAEPATIRLDADGGATILIGTQSTGQGHETAYAQLAAGELGLPLARVRVRQGDSDDLATGGGTGGSRSLPVGGPAVRGAARRLADHIKELAAEALEADAADLELADGQVRVAGTDRGLALADIAALPGTTPERLTARDSWKPSESTYPNGTHVCEVEIDPETGATRLVAYVVVDDFGVTLNPMLLAGQVHGGVAQGIGQALTERVVYDASGQLLTASLSDYALPRADDLPSFVFETRNVPCATNALGLKGAGEAGSIGSCPAVMNAIVDALHHAYGIVHLDMPATPALVAAAIHSARKARDSAA